VAFEKMLWAMTFEKKNNCGKPVVQKAEHRLVH
jgi:hypothetical protein